MNHLILLVYSSMDFLFSRTRNRSILTFALILSILSSQIFPDTLYLKNKQKIEGIYISEDKDEVIFGVDFEKTKSFSKKEILNIELDFSGLPVQYSTQDDPKAIKKGIIYSIDQEKAVIIQSEKDTQKLLNIKIEDIYILRAEKKHRGESITKILRPKAKVKLEIKEQEDKEGLIENVQDKQFNLKENSQASSTIEEEKVTALYINNKPRESNYKIAWNYFTYLIPGYNEFFRETNYDKAKGVIMFSSFLFLAAMIPYKYNQALAARDNDYDFVPIGGRVYMFQNLTPSNAYSFHAQTMYVAVGALVLLYMIHGFDTYFYLKKKEQEEKSLQINFNPAPQQYNYAQGGFNTHNNLEIKFMYSF